MVIYLDNSATTKPDPEVLASFQKVSEEYYANPSSIHQFGGNAEKLLVAAKRQAAQLLQAEQEEIIFTSGGTEGNNMAVKGIALEHQQRGKHIITSSIEHPSIYEACKALEKLGFEVTYLPVNEKGIVSVDDVKKAIRKDTILVTIMHVNNEIGSIQPIAEIGKLLQQYPKIFFHVDNVQGFGKVPLHLKNAGIDLCTISGHKIHGLKGTGILYVRKGVALFPLFHGGEQELAIRSGTENLAGIVSLVKAMRLAKEREEEGIRHMSELKSYLIRAFEKMEGVFVNTPENSAPHIVNISVPGIKPEVIIHMLGEQNIYISTKSACSSKVKDESMVLAACGYSKNRTTTALRISLSYENTMEEMKIFVDALERSIKQFKTTME